MKRFGQFLREREEATNVDDGLIAILKMVAVDHRSELMSFLDDLAVSDHRLRERLDSHKEKASKDDQRLPPGRSLGDMDEIVPSTADGVGGTEEDEG